MPVDPSDLDDLAANVAAIYREAETALVQLIARHLAGDLDRDIPAPEWAQRKLAAVTALRRSAQSVVAALQSASDGAVRDAAARAFRAGWSSALAELPTGIFPQSGIGQAAAAAASEIPGFAAIEALAAAVTRDIGERSRNILRDTLDAYRHVITATVARTLTGAQTRREASQAAWQSLVDRGITGFVDRAGRRWQLSTYVEMATRTVTQRAAVTGQLDRLGAEGIDLVSVSNAPQECVLCRPWEGKVLDRTGDGGERTVRVEHAINDGEMVDVHVAGSVPEAMLAGLFHPQCRHSVSIYLPGVTRLPTGTADPDGDKARQQQRAIERRIRRYKARETGALTKDAKKAARARVRAAQADMRQHLADHPDLLRQSHREQIGAGNIPPRGRGDAAGAIGPAVQPTLDGSAAVVAPRTPTRVEPAAGAEPPEQVEPNPDQLDLLDQPQAPDLTAWTDDQLADGVAEHADDSDMLDAILAEMDRREQAEQAAAAAAPVDEGQADDPDAEKWARFDELVAQGVDDEQAYAEAFGKDVDRLRREDAIARLRAEGFTGRGFDELARAAYRRAIEEDYFSAEGATNGFLLTAEGQRKGIDPRTLWTQNETYARRWASDELREWWDEHGRLTFDQFSAQLLTGRNEQRFRTGGETWLQ